LERRLSAGCTSLDGLLGGGFGLGKVSLIYGEASTGKTTLALMVTARYLRSAPNGRAFYVDADRKLSTNRMTQILGDESDLLERLLVWRPDSFSEQTEIIERLTSFPSINSAHIVVDSITSLYRFEAGDAEKTFKANKSLNRQLGFLSEIAKASRSYVLLTGQVHGVPESETPQAEMVAQRLLRYWSDVILRLEMTPRAGIRQAVLEKPKTSDNICRFMLSDRGIEEAGSEW